MLLALRSLWEPSATLSTLPNLPGRVFKGTYPYWQQRRQPYWESDQERAEVFEEEEMLAMMGIEL